MIVNINTYSDVSFTRTFVYRDASLVPIDLTLSVLRMHVRAKAEDATVFIALSNVDPLPAVSAMVLTDPVGGKFTITIPYKVLLRLPVGVYVHSLVRTERSALEVLAGLPAASEGTQMREEIWRGTLTHAAGPTRWV